MRASGFMGAKVGGNLGEMGAIMPRREHLKVPGNNEGVAEGRERCSLNLERGK